MLQAIVTFFLKPIGLKFVALGVALLTGLAMSFGLLKWWERNEKRIKEIFYLYSWWALWLFMGVYFAAVLFPYIEKDEAFLEHVLSVPGFVQERYYAACSAHQLPAALCPENSESSPPPGGRKQNKVYHV